MADAKLKIGLVIDTDMDATDGVQQYVLTLGQWLERQGHTVRYLAGQTRRQDLPGLYSLAKNIRVRFNGNSLTIPLPANNRRIKQLLADEQFNILHVQTPHSPFMAQKLMLAVSASTGQIGTFHILPFGWASQIGNRLLGIWLRPSLKRFDEVVSVSPAAADFAQTSFGIKTDVVPNMIELDTFQNAKPLAKYNDDVLTILFLGRLVPRKGAMVLMEATKRLKEIPNLPKFRVIICGRGQQEPKLRQFITSNHLEDCVELVGFVSESDKPRYYASADIAVFPSQGGESFGIVLLEAMASGQSVVLAADNPGYRSVMGAQPDLLFKTGNELDLVDKLIIYLQDAGARQAKQAWAAKHVKQYDVQVVGKELLRRYQQALRKRRPA